MSDFKFRRLTPSDRPLVFAVDVTTTAISIVRMDADNDRPLCKVVRPPATSGRSHSVASTVHRQRVTTSEVLDTLLRDNIRPSLVVLGKLSWGLIDKDPSFPRRDGQWWDIARELARHRVPVAEVPLATVQTWALGKSQGLGRAGLDALAADISGKWEGLDVAIVKAGEGFRPSTVAFAAMGAMAAGISTPYAPTAERVLALSMRRAWKKDDPQSRKHPGWAHSNAVQWPAAVQPLPVTVADWNELHAKRPVAVAEPLYQVKEQDGDEAEAS